MNLRLAHGPSTEEIDKYYSIDGNEYISIAEYSTLKENSDLSPYKHNHDDYEFIIPFRTIPLIFYEQVDCIGEVGYCYPINPYSMHGIENASRNSAFLSIVIKKEYLEKIKNKFGFNDKSFSSIFNVGFSIVELVRSLQKLLRSPTSTNDEILTYTYLITAYLLNFGMVTAQYEKKPRKKYFPKLKSIVLYMYDNYKNPDLTIKDLADLSGYSVAYFTKSFKQFMNDTPINHLNKLRLSEAKTLFYYKKLTIKQIAKMVGYKNETTFTEAFKRINGELPKQYRKKYY